MQARRFSISIPEHNDKVFLKDLWYLRGFWYLCLQLWQEFCRSSIRYLKRLSISMLERSNRDVSKSRVFKWQLIGGDKKVITGEKRRDGDNNKDLWNPRILQKLRMLNLIYIFWSLLENWQEFYWSFFSQNFPI